MGGARPPHVPRLPARAQVALVLRAFWADLAAVVLSVVCLAVVGVSVPALLLALALIVAAPILAWRHSSKALKARSGAWWLEKLTVEGDTIVVEWHAHRIRDALPHRITLGRYGLAAALFAVPISFGIHGLVSVGTWELLVSLCGFVVFVLVANAAVFIPLLPLNRSTFWVDSEGFGYSGAGFLPNKGDLKSPIGGLSQGMRVYIRRFAFRNNTLRITVEPLLWVLPKFITIPLEVPEHRLEFVAFARLYDIPMTGSPDGP